MRNLAAFQGRVYSIRKDTPSNDKPFVLSSKYDKQSPVKITPGRKVEMKNKPPRSRHSRWPVILVIITAVTGIGLSLHIRSRIAKTETETARLMAEALRLNTEQEITLFVDVLESVRALHALSDAVNQAAMNEFIEKGLVYQHAVLGPFGLAQRVSPTLRLEIEHREKNNPGAYDIVQKGENGDWVPAQNKNVYYPLTWQSRANGLQVPIGFDFSSEPGAKNIIRQIERTFDTSLVPEPTPSSTTNNPSYWVFSPVVPGRLNTPSIIIGFAVAVFNPEKILGRVTGLAAPSTKLELRLSTSPEADAGETIRRTGRTWSYQSPIEAINTHWLFECTLPVGITGHRSETAFITGLIFTALMTVLLLLLSSRTRKIEAEVKTRTEDLRIANTQLEANLRERARMEEEMNELAAREQRRIGRDLHDSLGQKLTGAVFLSRSLLNWFKDQESGVRGQESGDRSQGSGFDSATVHIPHSTAHNSQSSHAQTLNETLKASVSQVRNMARGLASVTLNEENLEESLDQLADEMGALYNTSCRVEHTGSLPALNRKTKEQLYFIAREAVNNAARHAQAQHIIIRLSGDPSAWTLRVEDDGIGLPTEQPAGEGTCPSSACQAESMGGMGLRIMRHRAGRIGAQFTIHSTPNHGTTIEIKSE